MRIAICDDSRKDLHITKQSLEIYLILKKAIDYQLNLYDNPLLFLEDMKKNGGYDIVLLDICMPGISGTSVAHEIREKHDTTEIIFITASNEFAVDAFALNATHYLIKPYKPKELFEAMDRAISQFKLRETKKLAVKTEGGNIRFIDISDIMYIESMAHVKTIYLKESTCKEMRKSLRSILQDLDQLSPGQFISPFKGYIVNHKAIEIIGSKHIKLTNRVKIPIARNTFRILKKQYSKFMNTSNYNYNIDEK